MACFGGAAFAAAAVRACFGSTVLGAEGRLFFVAGVAVLAAVAGFALFKAFAFLALPFVRELPTASLLLFNFVFLTAMADCEGRPFCWLARPRPVMPYSWPKSSETRQPLRRDQDSTVTMGGAI